MKLKRKKMTKEGIFGLVVLIFALTAPLYITKAYNVHLLVLCAIYVGLASSLNLILGYAGLFSLAHAAFFGMGAYTSAILVGKLGLPIWVGFACSGFIAAIFGLLIAYPSLKLRGDYLAIVTLGFGQIVRLFELNEQWLTNGAMGITAIPKPTLFGEKFGKVQFYYLALLICLLIVFIVYRIAHSRIGRALIAIREDDLAAMAIGINVRSFKMLSFGVGCWAAGLMGSVYAHYITFVAPDQYTFQISVNIFIMVVVGGMGTTMGPVIGACILTLLPELLRGIGDYRMLIYGLLLVVCMIFRPQGVLGSYEAGGTSIWTVLRHKMNRQKASRKGAE